jgi:formylglycine-generating enzyme required for sulfatase activity
MSKRLLNSQMVGIFTLFGLLFPFTNFSLFSNQQNILQDTTAPSPVISLNASSGAMPGSVELRWIAPGDDGSAGTASAYIVRHNTVPILQDEDEDTWTTAVDVDGEPRPSGAGSLESMTVSGLEPGKPYYFSLKTVDDGSNTSGVSNIARATALSLPNKIHMPVVFLASDLVSDIPVIPPTTVVIPDTTLQYLDSLSDDMTFTFSQWTPELEKLRDEGGIMVGGVSPAAPSGFLRKVKDVSYLCEKVVVTTELATLEEAIETGSVQLNQPLKPDQVALAQHAPGVTMASSDGLHFEFSLNDFVLWDKDGKLSTTYDQIKADGTISLELGLDFGVKINWFKLKRVWFNVSASEQVDLTVKGSVSYEEVGEQEFSHLRFGVIVVMIGPVPVVVEPGVTLKVGGKGEISAALTVGVTQQAALKIGAAYENGQWSGISEFNNQFQFNTPEVTGTAKFRAWVSPVMEFDLYGVAGPYVVARIFIEEEASLSIPSLDLTFALYAGISLEPGADVEILGKTLADYRGQAIEFRILLVKFVIGANRPPDAPKHPNPRDDTYQPSNLSLMWTGADPDGDPVTYDLYLEANDPYPDKLVWSGTETIFSPTLDDNTDYYWRVVAKDDEGATSAGLVWSFHTGETTNNPPYEPASPSPGDEFEDQGIFLDLGWSGGDPDGDTVTYEVYLETGDDTPDVLACEDVEDGICYTGELIPTTMYFWQVVAQDEHGSTTPGPVWSFQTGETTNNPPYTPVIFYPGNAETNIQLRDFNLEWSGYDPDDFEISYDVYFEAEDGTPDALLCNITNVYPGDNAYCDPGLLLGNTGYYWQVVARDARGATTTGPVWMFTTADMVYVPAGEFQMGCDLCNPNEQCNPDELPLHTVYLSDYTINRTEVTNAEYAACVKAGVCDPPQNNASRTRPGYYGTTSWSLLESGTANTLFGVWGSGERDVFVVGEQGTILHYDGSAWSTMSSSISEDLYGVWGSSGEDVYAVGGGGTILHYNGTDWSTISSGTTYDLNNVWGSSASDVFAVGPGGLVLHFNGDSWSPMNSGTTNGLYGIWGSNGDDVYAVGNLGTTLFYGGSNWTTIYSGTDQQLRDVWGSSSSYILAVGAGGTILHSSGDGWNPMNSYTTNPLYGVWGSGERDVFVVGEPGTILHYDGSAWDTLNSSTTNPLYGVWGSNGDDVYAVGEDGTILHTDLEYADYPVLWVDWENATNYCSWVGAKKELYWNLPTEAQWEKATRGSSDILKYPWGFRSPDCSLANHMYWNGSEYEYCMGDTSYVGAYLSGASPYGVLDMSGNVGEWVRDWYSSSYYSEPLNLNPLGPLNGTKKVVRGGSWFDDAVGIRAAIRSNFLPDYAGDGLGFRCVWEIGE